MECFRVSLRFTGTRVPEDGRRFGVHGATITPEGPPSLWAWALLRLAI
jgi:hypothetical protein